jgi:hypothetical protein
VFGSIRTHFPTVSSCKILVFAIEIEMAIFEVCLRICLISGQTSVGVVPPSFWGFGQTDKIIYHLVI